MIDVSKVAYNVYAVLQDGTRLNVTPAVMDLGWEEGESELSSRFSFTVANVDYNGSPLSSTIKPNTAIVVTASAGGDEQEVASGKVIEWNPQDGAAMKDFSVVCYDDLYNLQKSQDDRYIKAGTGTKSALNAIFSDWGIPAGEYKGPDKPPRKNAFQSGISGGHYNGASGRCRKARRGQLRYKNERWQGERSAHQRQRNSLPL